MKIYIGLWSVGVYQVEEAIELVKRISKTGTHHQVLTAGYFCANLDNQMLAHELAAQVLAEHRDEQDAHQQPALGIAHRPGRQEEQHANQHHTQGEFCNGGKKELHTHGVYLIVHSITAMP